MFIVYASLPLIFFFGGGAQDFLPFFFRFPNHEHDHESQFWMPRDLEQTISISHSSRFLRLGTGMLNNSGGFVVRRPTIGLLGSQHWCISFQGLGRKTAMVSTSQVVDFTNYRKKGVKSEHETESVVWHILVSWPSFFREELLEYKKCIYILYHCKIIFIILCIYIYIEHRIRIFPCHPWEVVAVPLSFCRASAAAEERKENLSSFRGHVSFRGEFVVENKA